MAASLAFWLRTVFLVLGCVITATVIYTIATDGSPFRKELLTPWMTATLVDFYINILPIGAWIVYKESNYVSAIIWIVLLICLGSITTCGYIFIQFLKLSHQESLQDPIYFVLLRNKKEDGMESKSILSVISAGILFSILGCLMLGTLIYTMATNGSPFRRDIYTPWLLATLVDFCINVVALSVWVAYKESNWKTAALWIILLFCFGSVSTCIYIVLNLFHLSSQDPAFLVLFSSKNSRDRMESKSTIFVVSASILFSILGCLMVGTLVYGVTIEGSPFRRDIYTPWMIATLVYLYTNILPIGAWIVYKESNYVSAIIWTVLLICLGSIATYGYIVIQILKLSPQESLQDPIYFILLRNRKRDRMESKSILSVSSGRIFFSILGCLMPGALVYTMAIDGSPFRRDIYTPWLLATLIDFFLNLVALLVWVAYKESNWKTAAFWIILFTCFGRRILGGGLMPLHPKGICKLQPAVVYPAGASTLS